MARGFALCAALLIGTGVCAQEPAQSSPSSSSRATSQDQNQQATPTQQPSNDSAKKEPGRLKRTLKRAAPNCVNVAGGESCWSENQREKEEKEKQQRETEDAQSRVPKNQEPPRSEAPAGQSSSRDTQIDLSPPPDDMKHEGADITGVTEFHAYDPHKAAKNIEVGDYYFKRKNYRAAESRYEEALQWKPNDAEATFRLAQSEEKLGKRDDALKNYQAYLKILPSGDFAAEAKSGIERLNK